MFDDHAYFTVDGTSYTISRPGALAVYCGDAPKKNEDGTTSHSMRGPLLLMDTEMWKDGREVIEKIAEVLDENAGRFFKSARGKGRKWQPVSDYTPGREMVQVRCRVTEFETTEFPRDSEFPISTFDHAPGDTFVSIGFRDFEGNWFVAGWHMQQDCFTDARHFEVLEWTEMEPA